MPWSRARVGSVLLVGLVAACTSHEEPPAAEHGPSSAGGSREAPASTRSTPSIPSTPSTPSIPLPPPPATQVMQVSGGNYNACVRFDNGEVSCWGRCEMGCGVRSQEASTGLTTIAGVSDAVDVAVGDGFACAAQGDGRVRCWGSNFYGAVGTVGVDWAAAPLTVEGIADAVEVEASQTMSCARTRGGEVLVWGGVADSSPPPPESTRRPEVVKEMRGATALWSDPWGCCAALAGGSFACVQAGATTGSPSPTRSGACGCGLDAAGTLRCELRSRPGPPTADGIHPEPPRLPCSIDALDGVRDFVIADTAGYAIRRDGELWRWGGIDRWGTYAALARMEALPKVRSIATGVRGAVLAVDDAGALWGWGWSNEHGITATEGWIDAPVKIWPAAGK